MIKLFKITMVFLLLHLVPIPILGQNYPARLGMNISGIADYSTEFVWKDISRYMRAERIGDGFTESQFDADGYPTSLSGNQRFFFGFGNNTNHIWPAGDYHVFYDGEGDIEGRTAAETFVREVAPGHEIWSISHDYAWFGLQIVATNPSNHLRNLRIIMPGFEDTYQTDPLHPSFIEHWKDFEAFRFMDFTGTNNSQVVEWSELRTPNKVTQVAEPGAAPQLAVEICNEMQKDAWFCMPHTASDDMVRKWAEMVRDNLDPSHKVYVEYSNEVWNWAFQQYFYSIAKGKELIDPSITGPMRYYVYRSGQVWKIWKDVFGNDSERIINVFAWQTGDVHWKNIAFSDWFNDPVINPSGLHPEYVATAPYFSYGEGEPSTLNLTTLFNDAHSSHIPNVVNHMQRDKKLADDFGYEFVCYEAGQHYGEDNKIYNTPLDQLYWAANRDMRMKDAYLEYLNAWKNNSRGGLMMIFNSCGIFGEPGSWGALEAYNQDISTAPKYSAMMEFLEGSVITDTQAPTTPTNILTEVTPNEIDLNWGASTDNEGVVSYQVLIDGISRGFTADLSFNVERLTPQTSYVVTIRARDAAGNWSALSSPVTVTTLPTTPSVIYEAENATLSGGNIGTDQDGYSGTGFWGWVGSGNSAEFTVNVDETGNYDMTYRYSNGTGNLSTMTLYVNNIKIEQLDFPNTSNSWGNWSNTYKKVLLSSGNNTIRLQYDAEDVGAINLDYIGLYDGSTSSTDTQAPTIPTNLVASNITHNAMRINWTPSSDNVGVTGFEVSLNGSPVVVTSTIPYNATNLTADTQYTIAIRARDAAGNWSAPSASINVTTLPGSNNPTTIYEAEDAVLVGGGVATDHDGYSGTGFWAWISQGSSAEFTVNVTEAGSYDVTSRYTNGFGSPSTMNLYVNNVRIKQVSFPNTGGWGAWDNFVESVSLNAGNNTFRFQYNADDVGAINLDYIGLTSSSSQDNKLSTTSTELLGNEIKAYPIPATDMLHVKYAAKINVERLTIVNLLGKTLMNLDVKRSDVKTSQIDVSHLKEGLYLLRVYTSKNKARTFKFVKN